MKPRTTTIEAGSNVGAAGYYQYRVMNADGTPATEWSERTKNLVLPAGFDVAKTWTGNAGSGTGSFKAQFNSCHAGTGTTPNSAVMNGTYSQTGTTVTRVTGTGTFTSPNVDDFIKFGTGERAKIVSITNTVTVVVDRSQTVAATSLTIYDTSRLYLDTWVAATSTYDVTAGFNGESMDTAAGTTLIWKTYNFATEVAAKTYTEIGVSAQTTLTGTTVLFSRVVLPAPVTVNIGQFLQLRFELLLVLGNYRTQQAITMSVTGWPYSYAIQSIVSNGTYWDVVVGAACSSHYAVGRPIIITGALPATSAITTITSTVSDFTVTTSAAHGKVAGNSIVIAGSSVAGYNGTWTVLAAPTTTTLTVTSGANPGAATGGTLRLTTPGTWYDGTYTIASFPNSTTIRITNATSITAAGVAGTVTNSMAATGIITGSAGAFATSLTVGIVEPGNGQGGAIKGMAFVTEANMKTGMAYGAANGTWTTVSTSTNSTAGSYDASNRKRTFSATIPSANQVGQTLRQLVVGDTSSTATLFVVTFDERQRKDNGFQLVLNYTVSWEPDLS